MKILILCSCLLASPLSPQSTPPSATQNLRDDFAKSSFRVLRKIESEAGDVKIGAGGESLVPRATNEAIDNLDIDAQTKEELAVVGVLKTFLNAKLLNNLGTNIVSSQVGFALHARGLPYDPLSVSKVVARSPAVAKMRRTESVCSSELEAAFRARTYQNFAGCSTAALTVEIPKKLDVSLQATAEEELVPKVLAGPVTMGQLNDKELVQKILADPVTMGQIKTNSIESLTSSSATASKRWEIASMGHVLTDREVADMVKAGQASPILIVTTPAGAEVSIDGDEGGKTPQSFTLIRHGNVPRIITIKTDGYVTVEKTLMPDGNDTILNVNLVHK